ncbi:MAG: hypothetical protein EZS28_047450 [Streblomastix strix]|uniref:Uncharacterized protein n=1 Tax=Streblomastix strix TaxID=222440 RepID=A0A5J4TEZ2_9EUKA|nr:MAG: hypothetical protein EZS28_047450 [Streblomastix strix]
MINHLPQQLTNVKTIKIKKKCQRTRFDKNRNFHFTNIFCKSNQIERGSQANLQWPVKLDERHERRAWPAIIQNGINEVTNSFRLVSIESQCQHSQPTRSSGSYRWEAWPIRLYFIKILVRIGAKTII